MNTLLALLLSGCTSVTLPPERYDHTPLTNPVYRFVDFGQIDGICRNKGVPASFDREHFWACQIGNQIILPKVDDSNIDEACQQRLARHEIGHFNHWSWRHEDARY